MARAAVRPEDRLRLLTNALAALVLIAAGSAGAANERPCFHCDGRLYIRRADCLFAYDARAH